MMEFIRRREGVFLAGNYGEPLRRVCHDEEAIVSITPSARLVVSNSKARCVDDALVLSDEVAIRVEEFLIIRSVEAITVNVDCI